MNSVCLQPRLNSIILSTDDRIDKDQYLPNVILETIFNSFISTKSQLEVSQSSKHFYNVIFRNNPTLMMLRDVMKCAFKSKWLHLEFKEPKSRGGLRHMTASLPSSNRFLLQPNYVTTNNESYIENYDVTSLYDGNVTPEFKSIVKEIVDKKSYKTDKNACERKLFFDLIKYAAEKKCFVIDIGVERIKKSDNLNVIRIMKREYDQGDSSDICLAVFGFSGACSSPEVIDKSATSIFKTILENHKMIVPRPVLEKSEELKQKKTKKVKYEGFEHDGVIEDMDDLIKNYDEFIKALSKGKDLEERIFVKKIIVEDDVACRCTLF